MVADALARIRRGERGENAAARSARPPAGVPSDPSNPNTMPLAARAGRGGPAAAGSMAERLAKMAGMSGAMAAGRNEAAAKSWADVKGNSEERDRGNGTPGHFPVAAFGSGKRQTIEELQAEEKKNKPGSLKSEFILEQIRSFRETMKDEKKNSWERSQPDRGGGFGHSSPDRTDQQVRFCRSLLYVVKWLVPFLRLAAAGRSGAK